MYAKNGKLVDAEKPTKDCVLLYIMWALESEISKKGLSISVFENPTVI